MIHINLLPRLRRRRLLPVGEIGVVGVVILIVVGLIASYVYGQLQNGLVRLQTEAINHQIAQIRPRAAEVLDLEARLERLRAKEDLLKSLAARELPWADILADLAQRTPKDVWLSSATFSSTSPQQLTLQGTGFSYDATARFMTNLAASSFYSDVALTVAQEAHTAGRTVVTFSLVVTVRPAPSQIAAQGGLQ
jgi:Tfp pilus assembly protein PilN